MFELLLSSGLTNTPIYSDPYPGPKTLIAGTRELGLYGETTSSELFGYDDAAKLVNMTFGTVINDGQPWLKFSNKNVTCYIPKKPARKSIQKSRLNNAGLRNGDYEVRFMGNIYKFGLLTMAGATSEWQRLLYNVHVSNLNGANWPYKFTDNDLGINQAVAGGISTDGTTNWGRDPGNDPVNDQLYRGYYAIDITISSSSETGAATQGWRPVVYASGTYPFVKDNVIKLTDFETDNEMAAGAQIGNLVYYYGGKNNANTALRTLNLATGKLTTLQPTGTPIAVKQCSAVAFNGKVYFYGGESATDGVLTKGMQCYDPATNTWEIKSPGTIACRYARGTSLNGLIYILGAADTTATNNRGFTLMYNPTTDTYTSGAAFNDTGVYTQDYSVSVYNNSVCVIGGTVGAGVNTGIISYNQTNNNWSKPITTGIPLGAAINIRPSGELYVIAGENQNNAPIKYYEPRLARWINLGNLETDLVDAGFANTFNNDGKIYVLNGNQNLKYQIS
ncbi:virion structural protein [Pseudomonas phage 9Ps-7B]|nr:virion structural protein [Pseudomonas phage 9Ps-7B]